MYPYYYVNGVPFSTFQLMCGLGATAGILIFFFYAKKNKVTEQERDKLLMLLGFMIVGGIIGAVLYNAIVNVAVKGKFEIGGIAFAGGLLGAVGVYFAFYKLIFKSNQNIWENAGYYVPSILIAHCFGRIGCFLAGCCFGQPSEFLGVVFPDKSIAAEKYGTGVAVLPTQLIEAGFLLIAFFVFLFFIKKYQVSFYFLFYGVFRFILEFFRGDNRGAFFLGLSPSQWLCLVFIALGFYCLYKSLNKANKFLKVYK